MTPEAQRIAIAKACGWNDPHWECPKCGRVESTHVTYEERHGIDGCLQFVHWVALPDYLNDLNAMHAALKLQTQVFRAEFDRLLHAMAEEKHLLVTELEAKDWANCFISCLQSKRDSGN